MPFMYIINQQMKTNYSSCIINVADSCKTIGLFVQVMLQRPKSSIPGRDIHHEMDDQIMGSVGFKETLAHFKE